MLQVVRGLQWLSRLMGACELTLGLVIWFVGASSVTIHIVLGVVVTLILLIISGIAFTARETRWPGVIGLVYTCVLPAFGFLQLGLLKGSLHWLIQLVHLIIGIGSIGIIHFIGGRYLSLKQTGVQTASEQTTAPQATQASNL